jgi:NAD(P)H-dependent flavin oxidoreductase YrpB (nitropropane dioxygenase family)
MNAALRTRLCTALGLEVPIIQTGMGWVAGASLCAATSAAGGLGVLAAATMSPSQLSDAIRRVRERTDRPFGVNLRADAPDAEGIIDVVLRERVRVASFARAPGQKAIARFRDAGVYTIATVGAPRHAEKAAGWGIDALIAQGGEGGGHTGSIPTTLLLPAVVDAVDVPVVAAGGFFDGRGLVAALAWGADGVAMGTRFLLTQESTVPAEVKAAYLKAGLLDTVVTTAVDGVPQRVLRTPLIDRLEQAGAPGRLVAALRQALAFQAEAGLSFAAMFRAARALHAEGDLSWSQVFMAANAPMYTKAALVDGRPQVGVLPTGQVVGAIDELPTVADLITRLVAEADEALVRLGLGRGTA